MEEAVERAKNTHVATTSLFVSSGRRCSLNGVSHFGFEQSLASHICKVKNHASCERRTACGSLGPLSRTGCGCWCAASVSTCRTLPSKKGRKSMKRSEAMEGGKGGEENVGLAAVIADRIYVLLPAARCPCAWGSPCCSALPYEHPHQTLKNWLQIMGKKHWLPHNLHLFFRGRARSPRILRPQRCLRWGCTRAE